MRLTTFFAVLTTLVLAACGGAATPATPTAAPAQAVSPPASSGPLADLIAAARKEGSLNWAIGSDFTDGVDATKQLVQEKYGVSLQISSSSQLSFSQKISKTVTELQAGAPPTYDLMDVAV